jgi:outer membrane protein OmpA-like peptidoglycan-associated protein
MWRLICAALAATIGLFGTAGLEQSASKAQDLSLQIQALTFPTQALTFPMLDLIYKVEDMGGRVETLQVKETATETRIELPSDILFDFDKADIRAAAAEALKQVGDLLRKSARGTVRIEGHTDSKGSDKYNMRLSQRRAQSVRNWLVEREGLRNMRFAIRGFGETRPTAANSKPDGSDDPEGRQKNRRVEIVFGRR